MTLTALKATPPASAAHARITLPYPHFQRLESYPWKPWVMPGVAYKLLSINRRSGGFTCLLKVEPGTEAPVHHHLGAIEVIVLEGDIYYERNDIGRPGDYMYEPAGDIHQPRSDGGCVLFCVFEGAIAGLGEDGNIVGILDSRSMLEMATRDGAAQHVHS